MGKERGKHNSQHRTRSRGLPHVRLQSRFNVFPFLPPTGLRHQHSQPEIRRHRGKTTASLLFPGRAGPAPAAGAFPWPCGGAGGGRLGGGTKRQRDGSCPWKQRQLELAGRSSFLLSYQPAQRVPLRHVPVLPALLRLALGCSVETPLNFSSLISPSNDPGKSCCGCRRWQPEGLGQEGSVPTGS